jgi:multidrug resistance efflux pump
VSARPRPRRLRLDAATLVVLALPILAVVRCGFVSTADVATTEVRAGRFAREVAAGGTLKAVNATPITAPLESGREQKIAFLARDGSILKAGDLVVEFDPWGAQREASDGNADVAAAEAKIAKSRAEGDKNTRSLRLDSALAKEELDRAETFQLTDAQLFSRNEIIESGLDRDLFTKKVAVMGRKLETSGRLSSTERALGEIEAGSARAKVAMAEKGLRTLRIVAPHDGLLLLAKREWTGELPFVGASVWPGQKIAEIPDLSALEARVFVLETDAAGLKPGLAARLSIEGRPGEEYPATVARVDPLAKPHERQSPVKYFETTLSLKTEPARMSPGQRVRAMIVLEQVEGVIAIPRGALFEKDGRRVVYRHEGGRFVPVEVTVGRNSASRVVVEKGIREGDRVALRDPSSREAMSAAPGSPAPVERAR